MINAEALSAHLEVVGQHLRLVEPPLDLERRGTAPALGEVPQDGALNDKDSQSNFGYAALGHTYRYIPIPTQTRTGHKASVNALPSLYSTLTNRIYLEQ